MPDLEQRIRAWRHEMAGSGLRAPTVLDELESHLRDEVEAQVQAGVEAHQALDAAIQHLGPAQSLQGEFSKLDSRDSRPPKNFSRVLICGSAALVIGVALCGVTFLPWALSSSEHYASALGVRAPSWGLNVAFASRLMLGVGLMFAVAGGLIGLVRAGKLTARRLAGFRRHAIVLNLVLGALLTTPEVTTQLLLFLPLQLLYEGAVLSARWIEYRRRTAGP